ncbi:MAG: hypothetical protein HOP02_16565 [Methylococcaceae bacterium]|nr:hypothetical protein [Methylococcaceae bacterium]
MKIITIVNFLMLIILTGCASQGTDNISASVEPTTKNSIDATHKIANVSDALVIKKVVFGADSVIPQAVNDECDLPGQLSGYIKTAAVNQYASISEKSSTTAIDADVLGIEIINLVGRGGGAWSGPKSVMIKGTLARQGKELSSFKALRISGGGFMGGFKGTCVILERCLSALGEDVAEWLQNPKPNAMLGDMEEGYLEK